MQVLSLICLNLLVRWLALQGASGIVHGEEVVAVRLLWVCRCLQCLQVGTADRRWRPARMIIGVPGTVGLNRATLTVLIEINPIFRLSRWWMICIVGVLHSWVGLEDWSSNIGAWLVNALPVDPGNERHLFCVTGLALDDRGEGD